MFFSRLVIIIYILLKYMFRKIVKIHLNKIIIISFDICQMSY